MSHGHHSFLFFCFNISHTIDENQTQFYNELGNETKNFFCVVSFLV